MEIATDVQEAHESSPEPSSVHAVKQIYECCGTGCTQEASFICPMCKILGIDETLSSFCSQACFEADWTRHKHQHEKKNAAFFKSVVEKTEERIGSSKADKETHILSHTVSKKVPDFLFCWKEQQTSRHDDDEKNRKNHKKS